MSSTLETLDISKFIGKWYGIEHNISKLEGQCLNSSDEFSQTGNVVILTKVCENQGGDVSIVSGNVVPDKVYKGKFEIRFKSEGFLGTSKKITYIVYDTDYTSYAIVGNGDKGLFRIMSRDKQVEPCKLSDIEAKAQKLGFNISKIIREYKVLKPCGGK